MQRRSHGIAALSGFFLFGALMSGLQGFSCSRQATLLLIDVPIAVATIAYLMSRGVRERFRIEAE